MVIMLYIVVTLAAFAAGMTMLKLARARYRRQEQQEAAGEAEADAFISEITGPQPLIRGEPEDYFPGEYVRLVPAPPHVTGPADVEAWAHRLEAEIRAWREEFVMPSG